MRFDRIHGQVQPSFMFPISKALVGLGNIKANQQYEFYPPTKTCRNDHKELRKEKKTQLEEIDLSEV